jgi:hypothetical protein
VKLGDRVARVPGRQCLQQLRQLEEEEDVLGGCAADLHRRGAMGLLEADDQVRPHQTPVSQEA